MDMSNMIFARFLLLRRFSLACLSITSLQLTCYHQLSHWQHFTIANAEHKQFY